MNQQDDYIELTDAMAMAMLIDENDPLSILEREEDEGEDNSIISEEETMKTVKNEMNFTAFMDAIDKVDAVDDSLTVARREIPDWFSLDGVKIIPNNGYVIARESVKKLVGLTRTRAKWLARVKDAQERIERLEGSQGAQTVKTAFVVKSDRNGKSAGFAKVAGAASGYNPDGNEIDDVLNQLREDRKEAKQAVSKCEARFSQLAEWMIKHSEPLNLVVRLGDHLVEDDAGVSEKKAKYALVNRDNLTTAVFLRKQWEDNRAFE